MRLFSSAALMALSLMSSGDSEPTPAVDAQALVGEWVVDLRPTPDSDPVLKKMIVSSSDSGTMTGNFYDTPMKNGKVNGSFGNLRFAFTTADGSGIYHTQGVLRQGRIEGTTHSLGRDFLSVWTAYRVGSSNQDRDAVHSAVNDYVQGLYTAKPELIRRSVHPALHKSGVYRPNDAKDYRVRSDMNFEQLVDLASKWNANGKLSNLRKPQIEVLGLLDATASVKLVADWGIDYMHLIKQEGQWRILNVIWQSHPPKTK